MNKRTLPLLCTALAATSFAAGCANNRLRSQDIAYVEKPVEQLYNEAAKELDKRAYIDAVRLFDEVERQHPYSEWAGRANIMTAFAHYQNSRYDEAIASARRYIDLHPGNDETVYAYYLVAISFFEQILDVGRDQGTTEAAMAALNDVVRRYPTTEYASDARLKLDMVHDQLAGKEMEIGRWYLRRNQHLAAINRFQQVVKEYETTSHTPEALHRLTEAYLSIGLTDQAFATASVLGYNYGNSDWYARSYQLMTGQGVDLNIPTEANSDGWLSRMTKRMF